MSRPYRVVALPGEGIGPEVVAAALTVLARVAARHRLDIRVEHADFGIPAFEKTGRYLPPETLARCTGADGVLLGAVERGGLLELRRGLDVFANLRPVRLLDCLLDAASLRPELVCGLDLLFVRELTGGLHFGAAGRDADAAGPFGFHTEHYHDWRIRRIARVALAQARRRRRRLTVAHKENAMPRIPWCALVREEAAAFPEVEVEPMLVDNLAMQLVRAPLQFDVILASNMMGDWLSNIGGALAGSIGLLPSASLDGRGGGVYEPIHGTAPDLVGRGIANPIGAVLSAAMMLAEWGEAAAAAALHAAVERVLARGVRTPDLVSTPAAGSVTGAEMVAALLAELDRGGQ